MTYPNTVISPETPEFKSDPEFYHLLAAYFRSPFVIDLVDIAPDDWAYAYAQIWAIREGIA